MAWELTGNTGTDPTTNFLGTTDNQPLVIRTNGAEHLRITPDGNVGIGTTSPASKLYVAGSGRTALRIDDSGDGTLTTRYLSIWQGSAGAVIDPIGTGLLFLGYDSPSDVYFGGSLANGVWKSTGSVGIGTTNPQPFRVLDVQTTDSKTAVSGISNTGVGVGGEGGNAGVRGHGPFIGVRGDSPETGVAGIGSNGVQGQGSNFGVKGVSMYGTGVEGITTTDPGADAPQGAGVAGSNVGQGHGSAVVGQHLGPGAGVFGFSIKGPGVSGASVYSWCGEFQSSGSTSKGVFISVPAGQPGLQVASGTKSAVVATSQGTRALHTEESTAVWFTDYGFGHLQVGHGVVSIDPLFAETVNLSEPYHVFIQLNDANAEGVAVVNKTASSFEVAELRNGHSNAEFSYRLVAKRRGYETPRLEQAPWADDDPNLYPEKRSAWEAQQRLRRPQVSQVELPPLPPEMPR